MPYDPNNPFAQFVQPPNQPAPDLNNPFSQFVQPPASVANPPPATGQTPSSTPDAISPTDARLANIFLAPYRQYSAAKDYVTTALNTGTAGLADRASSWVSGTPLADEQAQTKAAQERLGPVLGTAAAGTGYVLGPGKILGPGAKMVAGPVADFAGGLIPSALEGTVAGGTQAAGEGRDIPTGAATGLASGAASVPFGTLVNSIIRGTSGAIGARAPVPSLDSLQDAESQMWGQTKDLKYSPRDTLAALRGARMDASAEGQPMTPVTNPKAVGLFDDFENHIANNPYSTVRELTGFQNKAQALTGDDARFGDILHDRIENTLQNAAPMPGSKMPPGMTLDQAPGAIQQAKAASALVDQYNKNLSAPPPTALSNVADTLGAHSWNLAHHGIAQPMVVPAAEALMAGGGTYAETGHWLPAVAATTATLAAQPALNAAARGMGNWQRGVSADAANRALMGIPNPNYRDALHQLLIGGAAGFTP